MSYLTTPSLTLTEFTAEVNQIAQKATETYNLTNPSALNKAVHHNFPERMIFFYYDNGYTPQTAYKAICEDVGH